MFYPIYNIDNPAEKRAPKQTFFFIWGTKQCPLSFTERIVWSLLVRAERTKGQGTTQADIADWSGLSRVTVREAVKENSLLCKKGLVIRENHRSWRAVEPSGETATWFATRKTKCDHWADRLGYWPVDTSSPVPGSIFDRALVGLLRTLRGNKPGAYQECYESLSVVLGCDYRRVKSGLQRLQEASVVEIINTIKNRYGRVVRFDVLLSDGDQTTRPASQALNSKQPVSQPAAEPLVKPAVQPMQQANKPKLAHPTPAPRRPGEATSKPRQAAKVIHEPPIPADMMSQRTQATESTEASSLEERIAGIRGLETEMREYMHAKGYEEWRIGQILGAICKVPMDVRRRTFFAIINKHGESPQAVVAEIRNNVERRKRRERAEAQEFFELEAMSLFVTA